MRHTLAMLTLTAALAAAGIAAAQENDNDGDAPRYTPPPPPEALTKGETVEPEVNIIEREWATITEFSVQGNVYAVRIDPAVGPPYYLYDANGDGSLDSRLGPLNESPSPHTWRILTW